MGLLRIDAGTVVGAVTAIQQRAFCHFASTAERAQQLPNPEVGTVSVIGTTFTFWNGTTWGPLLAALTTPEEDDDMPTTPTTKPAPDPDLEPVVVPDIDPDADPDDDDDEPDNDQ